MEKGLALMDKALGQRIPHRQTSVADAALFYVEFWASGRMKMPLPKNVAALRAHEAPGGERVLEQEGLTAAA
jgi:glutathione S-transferase